MKLFKLKSLLEDVITGDTTEVLSGTVSDVMYQFLKDYQTKGKLKDLRILKSSDLYRIYPEFTQVNELKFLIGFHYYDRNNIPHILIYDGKNIKEYTFELVQNGVFTIQNFLSKLSNIYNKFI